jgi:L-amino acid N-acyltransferase YncA
LNGYHEILAWTTDGNRPSEKLLRRIGFKKLELNTK